MRGVVLAFFCLSTLQLAQAEQAVTCGRLFVPDGIGLICAIDKPDGISNGARVVIKPSGGPFADFSRMSLRQLSSADNSRAWTAPNRWLRSQLTIDVSKVTMVLQNFAEDPDNPLNGAGLSTMVNSLGEALSAVGDFPLVGCDPIRVDESRMRSLNCKWGIDPVVLHMNIRLIEISDERYAINAWSMNEKRIRHFSAIANSFSSSEQ